MSELLWLWGASAVLFSISFILLFLIRRKIAISITYTAVMIMTLNTLLRAGIPVEDTCRIIITIILGILFLIMLVFDIDNLK